jgi:hypothetical protein
MLTRQPFKTPLLPIALIGEGSTCQINIPSYPPTLSPPSPPTHITTIPAHKPSEKLTCVRADTRTYEIVTYQTNNHGRTCRPKGTRHHSFA